MSTRHISLLLIGHIISALCPSTTWAYLPKRQAVPLYTAQWSDPAAISSSPPAPWSSSSSDWPNTAAASSTQAAAWSSSMPDWSDAAAAASTPAVSATPSYQPAAASTIGPSLTVTSPASASTCVTYDPCNLFYQYVTVLYWPGPSQNMACLGPAMTTPANPPGLTPQYPSLYVIFDSIIASNGCSMIGNTYASITASFAPGELSTIDSSGSAQVFNFDDLPCGPAGDNPSYSPLIAPPPFLTGLDPAFATCIPGLEQGIDPPVAVQPANGQSGLGGHGHHPRRFRRVPAYAPAVPTPS